MSSEHIYHVQTRTPDFSPQIYFSYRFPSISDAKILEAISLPFSHTQHMMQILLAQPSKDTQNQTDFTTTTNVTSLLPTIIVPFLDYANSLGTGFLALTLGPSSLVTTQQPNWSFKILSDHVTSLFKTLQWLPISIRVKPKVLQWLTTSPSCYLRDPVSCSSPLHSLSSGHTGLLAIPWTCQAHINPRAFDVLSDWNSPVPAIHMIHSLPSFMDLQKIPPYLLDLPRPPIWNGTTPTPHYAYSALFFPTALIFLWHITCFLVSLLSVSLVPHT